MAFENIQISLIAVGSAMIGGLLRPAVQFILGRMQHERETVRDGADVTLKVITHEDRRADEARQAVIDKQEERIDKLEEWLSKMVREYMDCERKSAALEERVRHCEAMEAHCERLEFHIEKLRSWKRKVDRGLGLDSDDE